MTLISLRSRSHVKASMVLTRADHSLYKIIKGAVWVFDITSTYYFNIYVIGSDAVRSLDPCTIGSILHMCLAP